MEFEHGDSLAGAAFLLRTREHGVVAVTARHLMDGSSGALNSLTLTTLDLEDVCSTETGIVPRGASGRRDLLFGLVEKVDGSAVVFELSGRPRPRKGDPVWVPVADMEAEHGVTWREGTVVLSESGGPFRATVPGPNEFNGASGSPVLCARDGRVIGMLTASGDEGRLVECVPVSYMRGMLSESGGRVGPLREVPSLGE